MAAVDYDDVQRRLYTICSDFSDIIGRVILFGSYSRREATDDSDIDLYIESASEDITTTKLWKSKRYKEFQYRLFDSFPQEFDLLAYGGKRDLASIRKTPLWTQIKGNGVTIYDQRTKTL